VGLFVAMRHFKHNYAVVQHLVVKIPMIITIGEIMNNKKPSNSLNLLGLFEKWHRRRKSFTWNLRHLISALMGLFKLI
jgi:hypothetical protein